MISGEEEAPSVAKSEEDRLNRAFNKNKSSGNLFKKVTVKPVDNKSAPPKQENPKKESLVIKKPVMSEEEKKKQEEIERMILEREKKWQEEKEQEKTQINTMSQNLKHSNPIQANFLKLKDENSAKQILEKLYDNNDPTRWIIFHYTDVLNEIDIEKAGETGLEELKQELPNNQIKFVIIQEHFKSGYTQTSKFCVVQWIGSDVPAGMQKARAASHRVELINFCKKILPIGGELQANSRDDLTEDAISQSFGSSTQTKKGGQEETESLKGGRGKKLGELRYANEEEVSLVLTEIHNGTKSWAILAYSTTENGVIELLESGVGGAEELSKRFPVDRIFFCPISVPMNPNPKYALVTCVGVNVPPLQKARCSGEISKVADKMKSVIPFHAYFQPIDAEDLTDNNLIRKLT